MPASRPGRVNVVPVEDPGLLGEVFEHILTQWAADDIA
jgi:hypothetical protein